MERVSPKVVDLDAYRKRKEGFKYPVGECEMIITGIDPPEGYVGTWTPQAPYGDKTDEDGEANR